MDSKELIKAYIEHYTNNAQQAQAQSIEAAEVVKVKEIAGGEEGYNRCSSGLVRTCLRMTSMPSMLLPTQATFRLPLCGSSQQPLQSLRRT